MNAAIYSASNLAAICFLIYIGQHYWAAFIVTWYIIKDAAK